MEQNLFHIAKNGKGTYPAELFTKNPDWEYRPWSTFQGKSNEAFLAEFIQLLRKEGVRMLFRDVSFLGFPACHIVIPDFHPIHAVNGRKVRARRTELHAAESLRHLPDLSAAEARRLLTLIQYNEGNGVASTVANLLGLPLSNSELEDSVIGFWLAAEFEEWETAEHFLGRLLAREKDEEKRSEFLCIRAWLNNRRKGISKEETAALIQALFKEGLSACVCRKMMNPLAAAENYLIPVKCPDCEQCYYYENGCDYPAEKTICAKVMEEMKKSDVRQETLLQKLVPLYQE